MKEVIKTIKKELNKVKNDEDLFKFCLAVHQATLIGLFKKVKQNEDSKM